MNSFMAEVPVTVRGGTLFLDGGVSISNTSAIVPEWTVEAGATLLLGGGRVVLGGDSETAGRLTLNAGAILDCASSVTTISTIFRAFTTEYSWRSIKPQASEHIPTAAEAA